MTDMMKKDNDVSRVASGLMAVAVVALVIIGWIAAVVTSGEAGISKLEPWWRGLSAIFFLMALLWTAHFFLPRRIPLTASVILAAASAMITVLASHSFGLSAGEISSGRYRLSLPRLPS